MRREKRRNSTAIFFAVCRASFSAMVVNRTEERKEKLSLNHCLSCKTTLLRSHANEVRARYNTMQNIRLCLRLCCLSKLQFVCFRLASSATSNTAANKRRRKKRRQSKEKSVLDHTDSELCESERERERERGEENESLL